MEITAQRMAESLLELARALGAANVPFAVAGGHAVSIHAQSRATKDVDILTRAEQREPADRVMRALGYRLEGASASFALYVRTPLPELPGLVERVDLLFSSRPLGQRAIDEAMRSPQPWHGVSVPVVPLGVLVVMKVMALVDNPERPYDLGDLKLLLAARGDSLDLEQLRRDADSVGPEVRQRLEQLLNAERAREPGSRYADFELRL